MTQSPAAITAHASKNAKGGPAVGATSQTCPRVTLEIGVFFDGTGNNLENARKGKFGSYANARSNVALLSQLYKNAPGHWTRNSCGGYAKKFGRIYVEGIGTRTGQMDDYVDGGMPFGMGPTGVEARVLEAFGTFNTTVERLAAGAETTEIVVDVFGFSRGAAAARYFVNCLRQGYIHYTPFGGRRRSAFLNKKRRIRIRFIGIFDTVASIGDAKDNDNGAVNLHVKTAQADRIMHLTATHEYRARFRLDHNLPGGGIARPQPGAHSDVGGGYGDPGDNVKVYSGGKLLTENVQDANDLKNAERRWHGRANAARAQREAMWVKLGFLNPNEPQHGYVEETTTRLQQQRTLLGSTKKVFAVDRAGFINRPWVQIGLSRIPLRIMYLDAVRARVPFLSYPKTGEYVIPTGLSGVANKLIQGQGLTEADIRHTLRNYGHISAHLSMGMEAEVNYKRVVYPNQPSKAI